MQKHITYGHLTKPSAVGGLLPRGKVSVINITASPATNTAALADIAVGVAADPASTALSVFKLGEPRRSLAGLLRSPTLHSSEPVVVVTSGAATAIMDSVLANALARGIRGLLPVNAVRAHPSPAQDDGIFVAVREARAALGIEGGAIIVVAEFSRELFTRLLALRSSFLDAAIVLATSTPAEIHDEFLGARLGVTDDQITCEPANGASVTPFSCKWAKDAVVLGSDEIRLVSANPRRAWAPLIREKAEAPKPVMQTKPREEVAVIYLLPIPSTRELTPDERDLFGDAPWTSDRMTALKLAAGVPGPAVISVCHAPDRDPGRQNADADVSWLTSEIRHQGLAEKIIAERAPFGVWRHSPLKERAA